MNYNILDLPNEIITHIFSFLKDPDTLSNVSISCKFFKNILYHSITKVRSDKSIRKEMDLYWPLVCRNSSLKKSFITNFYNIMYIDFPIKIYDIRDFNIISKFPKLKRITFKIDYNLHILNILIFIDNYNNYRKDFLKNLIIKIITKRQIRWITYNHYGIIFTSYPLELSYFDLQLIKTLNVENLYTNAIKTNYFDVVKNIYIVKSYNELTKEDFEIPHQCDNYIWLPTKLNDRYKNIEQHTFNNILHYSNVKKYVLPIPITNMFPYFLPNLKILGIYIENMKHLEDCYNIFDYNLIIFYNKQKLKISKETEEYYNKFKFVNIFNKIPNIDVLDDLFCNLKV